MKKRSKTTSRKVTRAAPRPRPARQVTTINLAGAAVTELLEATGILLEALDGTDLAADSISIPVLNSARARVKAARLGLLGALSTVVASPQAPAS
jgi:hypothetical protein